MGGISYNCLQLTRSSESGVYGFLEHLDSRAAASLLLDSIATESRQQMIFHQFHFPCLYGSKLVSVSLWLGLYLLRILLPARLRTQESHGRISPFLISQYVFLFLLLICTPTTLLSQNNPNVTGFYNTSIVGNDTTPAITRNRIPLWVKLKAKSILHTRRKGCHWEGHRWKCWLAKS